MVAWKSMLPLIFVIALVVFEERISIPSCETVSREFLDEDPTGGGDSDDDLKVMMVANLLLLGSEAGYMNTYFRYSYLTKFFRKSFERLKPDMLIVLGDVSARGSELTNSKWLSVLQQFQGMLGPFLSLPLHIVLGDRDVGECNKVNERSVSRIASSLPGLGTAGCGAFEVSNVSFVSLNAVAMLCGNNDLRFSVEKVIERESLDLRIHNKDSRTKGKTEPDMDGDKLGDVRWRETAMSSRSGPVLLLHFPLHRTTKNICGGFNVHWSTHSPGPHESSKAFDNRLSGKVMPSILTKCTEGVKTLLPRLQNITEICVQGFVGPGPYELFHTVPPNATEYIFQALKPRIIFSAHTHEFCDHIHRDGTREVTVPAMTWDARDDPGFVFVTFGRNRVVTVSHCSLARESHVLMAYISVLVLLISTLIMARRSQLLRSGR